MKNDILKPFYKFKNLVKKYAPELLTGAGIALSTSSTIFACRGTLKAYETLKIAKESFAEIDETVAKGDESYTEEDGDALKTYICKETSKELIKDFIPAVGLGIASAACHCSSINTLQSRVADAAGAATAIAGSFASYRAAVAEEIGDEKERDIANGIKTVVKEETVTDEKTGKKKKVKKETKVNTESPLLTDFLFDEINCPCTFDDNPNLNLMMLQGKEAELEVKLRIRESLSLADILFDIGYDYTSKFDKDTQAYLRTWGYIYNPNMIKQINFHLEESPSFISRECPEVWLHLNEPVNLALV